MGAITTVTFDPALPAWALAALGTAALALLGWGAVRRAHGLAWRALVMAALWLALLGPSVTREERRALADVVALVTDHTASQEIGARMAAADEAARAIETRLAALGGLEVRTVTVDGRGGADGTRLFTARDRLLADVPAERVAGTIMITDGQVHDAGEAKAEATGPLHVLLTGARAERDRRLAVVNAPSYGIVGDKVALAVRVEDERATAAEVVLEVRGDGRRLRRAPARIGERTELEVPVAHAGVTAVEIEVEPAAGELTTANNKVVVLINGVRDRLRVMLVSGEPNPGLRTWRNLLKADPSVDLVHFTILRPPNKQDMTPVRELSLIPFPTNELFAANLAEFDLVIFDNYHRRGILPMVYLANVVDYVMAGGAVLDAAGPSFASPLSLAGTPVGTILPGQPTGRVFRDPFTPQLTPEGRRHPVTATLPGSGATAGEAGAPQWGRWFRQVDVTQNGGVALMSGIGERPLLVLDRIGDGRVAQLLSDQSWLWARGYEGGGPQSDLLRRLVHWLMKEPDLEEESLVARVVDDRVEVTRHSLNRIEGEVAVTGPDGTVSTLALEDQGDGRATATVTADAQGLYRLDQDGHTAIAVVGAADALEMADARATDAVLRGIAEAGGGSVTWLADSGVPDIRRVRPGRASAGRGWIGLVQREGYQVTGLDQMPLLPAWLMLTLGLGGLMLAWRAEGR